MKKYFSHRLYFGLLVSVFLSACASKETRTEAPSTRPSQNQAAEKPSAGNAQAPEIENIDEVALQKALGLEKPETWLGYTEKPFNTCQVGYGYSKVNNCRPKHFVVVHFQLMCRDSEGTVSEVVRSADLIKNGGRQVRWNLKDLNGNLETDGLGYGQIHVISSQSQKQQRLKLTVENDFLYLRAGEVNRIVTPRTWCR